MKFTVAAALFAAGVSAYGNVTYVTETVSSVEYYCPGPTEITQGSSTYTVTEATTLTITDCPCTVTKPVTTTSEVICHTCGVETPVPEVPVPTGGYNSTIVTLPTVPGTGAPPAPPASTSPSLPGGSPSAAGKTAVSAGLLAGVIGLIAFL